MNNLFDLSGKVAVVTGAAGGIGAELAKAFAAQGADVALLDLRPDKLITPAREIESAGRQTLSLGCDVIREDEIETAVQAILQHWGQIDILVNNAGVASAGSVEELEEREWDRVIDTNLKSIFLMSKHVIKPMKERRYGRIINMASICGMTGSKSFPLHAYNASKGAVLSITRGMGASLAPYGITVNAIGPSLFRTEMTERALYQDSFLQLYNAQCPIGRPGNPEEINGAAIYFASDASSYTTGQTLYVDGGWTSV
ncbi:SDR family NAD(P)-dependent oxidoreductase [Paenibacillus riograndensis]|uniref:Short-chain dehydrogenase/reductase SDR n=1 Tax=Paenibacillus riograndensis SBR5 TaxID=1073571 RepID=A0A0E4CVE7_9BACL|nr:3-oxoacyl-ACP reductase family protein [Paenibacillus riograndensis]CQR54003.1 short-chain dehydrogenase/reductase SDR [Paenibacillus riograndensis SBR5]